jgi:hypothetical protein
MKIYDHINKTILTGVTLFLTPDESLELADSARDIALNPKTHQHHHVLDQDFKREIIVAVYTDENLAQFDSESLKVISGTSGNEPE